ncbi:hypothetical protein Pan153_17490 [Gimesia panareensis]|uniref:Uncharacterized protein n=1 Tax=Gimesia panareensis TaxID=2527978 RepID=A0A518FL76_9PLAN|nr:hypothetical protein Pan153_17490 [Gimesia panareensis]
MGSHVVVMRAGIQATEASTTGKDRALQTGSACEDHDAEANTCEQLGSCLRKRWGGRHGPLIEDAGVVYGLTQALSLVS